MPDAATADAMTHEEARLLQRVRLQLALWSGGVTLVLLLLLGAVLYIAVDRSLSNSGTAQLVNQANRLTGGRPGPDALPEGGFNFGGPGSGTFTMVLDQDGDAVGPGGRIPQGLPVVASIEAARTTGLTDIREATVAIGASPIDAPTLTPVRVLTEPVLFRGQQLYLQIVGDRTEDIDVVGIAEDDLEAAVQVFYVRRGRVVGRRGFVLDKVEELSGDRLIAVVLENLYYEEPVQGFRYSLGHKLHASVVQVLHKPRHRMALRDVPAGKPKTDALDGAADVHPTPNSGGGIGNGRHAT